MKKILFIIITCLCWTAYTSPAFGKELLEINLSADQVGLLTSEGLTEAIEPYPHLEKVDLNGQNLLSMQDIIHLMTQLELKWLSLRNVNLQPGDEYHSVQNIHLSSLETLDLSGNPLQAIWILFKPSCPQLTTLRYENLGNAPLLDDAVPYLLKLFPAIESIDISGQKLSENGMTNLLNHSNIYSLTYRENSLNGIFIPASQCNDLQYLDLSNSGNSDNLQSLRISYITAHLPNLETLKLGKVTLYQALLLMSTKPGLKELCLGELQYEKKIFFPMSLEVSQLERLELAVTRNWIAEQEHAKFIYLGEDFTGQPHVSSLLTEIQTLFPTVEIKIQLVN